MKKITLFLITLITLANISYASFPVETHVDVMDLDPYGFGDVLGSIIGLSILYLLFRFFRKGNRRTKRILLFVLVGILVLLILIALSSGPIGLFV